MLYSLKKGWVVVFLRRTEAGIKACTEAFVLAHVDDGIPYEQPGAMAVRGLGSDEIINVVLIRVFKLLEHSSGVHAFCHIMELDNLGHHWVNELHDKHIMDIRNTVRYASRIAFLRAVKEEDVQNWIL